MFSRRNGSIVVAAALTLMRGEDYHDTRWGIDAADDEVAEVHLLCVEPLRQKSGLAGALMRELLSVARAERKKAARPDALSCDLPAHRLYEGLGFTKRGVEDRYTADTGRIDLCVYEYIL